MKVKLNKKLRRIIVTGGALAAVAIPTAAIVACGTGTQESSQKVSYAAVPTFTYAGPSMAGKKFYGIMSDPENPRWQKAKSDLAAAAAEANFATTDVAIQKTQDDQNNALGSVLDRDAYVLGATSDGGFASQINSIATKNPNAKVIAYDRLIKVNSSVYNWYVTFDSAQVGRLQGLSIINSLYGTNFDKATITDKEILTEVSAKPKLASPSRILALAGDPSDNNAELFFNGAQSVLDLVRNAGTATTLSTWTGDTNLIKAGSWDFKTVAQPGWNYQNGQTYLQTALNALSTTDRNSVKALLAPNDGMAISATNAARYAGLDPNKIWITGLDSNDSAILAIFNGTGQDMTIFKPDFALARVAVALAATLLDTANANSTPAQIVAKLAVAYPKLADYSPSLNTQTGVYTAPASGSGAAKEINTVLLNPSIITKANLATYFTVS